MIRSLFQLITQMLLRPFGFTLVRRPFSGMLLQRLISVFLHPFGYTLVQQLPRWGRLPYEFASLRPMARYAPWMADPAFAATYDQIADATLVDIYRCFELWTLVEQTAN